MTTSFFYYRLASFEPELTGCKNKVVFYDMRAPEEEIWGLGLGCNGAVRILLQFVPGDNKSDVFDLFEQALETKSQQVLLSVCESTSKEMHEETHLLLDVETPARDLFMIYPKALKGLRKTRRYS